MSLIETTTIDAEEVAKLLGWPVRTVLSRFGRELKSITKQ